ncbi:unnamed protein product [Closterium sp. NIES-53]
MAYGVLRRNMSSAEQLSIRSYKTTPALALDAWRHLNGVYGPKDSVSSSRLLQQLLETKMALGEKVNSYINRCWSLRNQIAKLGSTISEEIFVNIVLQGLRPAWRPYKALLRQQGVISKAALCAALLVEQRDMDQQRPALRRDRERLAFYADNTKERQPRRLYCKICRNFSSRQDARNDTRQAQGHQPPPRNLNPAVQHQQQQSPQTAPVRNVMGNMTMTSGSRHPRARSPSPEPARQPIGAFSNNNPFSTRHDFIDDDEQDWNLPVPLLEIPPHIPDLRAAPIDWISREQFLKFDWGNEPSTARRTVYEPAPEPREPTFFLGTIRGTNIPLSNILDKEFLALMLTTANDEEEDEEAMAEPAQAPNEDPAEAHARYMLTSGFCADDAIWHQRLGHPSRNAEELHRGRRVCTRRPPAHCWHRMFRLWLAHAHRQSGEKLKIWQYDEAAEFRNKEMQDYLAKKGIEHHVSLPYAHQQHGVVERTNRTLMTKVRALMKQSKLLPTYWTYAMHHAVRVHNLLSTTVITGNSSPHVKWIGTKGNTSMLRVSGCMMQYRPPTSTIGNFTSRARWGIHLEISHEHKAWLILDLMSQKVKNARDVIFYERLFLRKFREDEQANANRVYADDGHSYASPEDEATAAILKQDPRGEFTRGDRSDDENNDDDDLSPGGGAGAAGGGGSGSGRGAAPPASLEPESNDDDVQEVIPQHRHDNTVSGLQLLGLHTATDTWVLVDRAAIKGRRILSGKWVFHVKTAADGMIERFKARWVVRGYDQRHGIDFDQTFALVSRHTSVRILLAIAAARHLLLQQIDVKNAFLYALEFAAPRLWQQYLHNILLEIGFKQLPHDPGMYRRDFQGEYILLAVYVGDLLCTGSSNELLEQFEKSLAGRVDITCNHDVKQFLGLNISYSPEAIHLSAAKYAEELGKHFNIAIAPLSTPYRTPGPNHKPDNKAPSPAGLHTYQQQL